MGKRKYRLTDLFIIIAAAGCVSTLIAVLCTPENRLGQLFFFDYRDTGMDFFHSIEYVRGGAPYRQYHTLYPPLANLLFFILFRFVPFWQHRNWANTFETGVEMRGGALDLRTWQPTMMLYVLFILFSTFLLVLLMQRALAGKKGGRVWLAALLVLMGNAWLYALERGNIIVLALCCTLFFLLNYDADKPLLRELALISLAVAAGLKLYPALFGLLLIYEKRYAQAGRCVAYGVALLVLPALCFEEGLAGLGLFWQALRGFAGYSVNIYGFSVTSFINSLAVLLHGSADRVAYPGLLGGVATILAYLLTATLLAFGFFVNKKWQRTLMCCAAMLAFKDQGMYAAVFFLAPLVMLLREEEHLDRENLLPFLALTAGVCMLPVFDKGGARLPWYYLRYQFCLLILVGCCLCRGAQTLLQGREAEAFQPRWKARVAPGLLAGALGLMALVMLLNTVLRPLTVKTVTAENALPLLLTQRGEAGTILCTDDTVAQAALTEGQTAETLTEEENLTDYLAAFAAELPATVVAQEAEGAVCASYGYGQIASVAVEKRTVQVWALGEGTQDALVRRIQLPAEYPGGTMRGIQEYALLEDTAHLFSSGGAASPLMRILPGRYTVTITGTHLDRVSIEVYSGLKGLVSRVNTPALSAEGTALTFLLNLKEMYSDLEIRVLNYSNEAATVERITVDAWQKTEET